MERQWGLREPTQEGDTVIRVLAIAALLALVALELARVARAMSLLQPRICDVWPPPRPNPKSWCSYPAPITFLPASSRRCRTNSPDGSRSARH